MAPEVQEGLLNQVVKRRISLNELRDYVNTASRVDEDVLAANGTVLLPKGTELASLVASVNDFEKSLRRWNIHSISIAVPSQIGIRHLEEVLKDSHANLMHVDPELAQQTIQQVGNVYERIESGHCEPQDIANLAAQGSILAKEIAQAPQVMLCLGRVRAWDEYTYVHSLNVALLGGFLAAKMFPNDPKIVEYMTVGGILHDLGKARIPISILNKPGRLTDEEFVVMQKHSEFGEDVARENGVNDPHIIAVIRGHHERFGGGGYPDSLSGKEISIESKIAAVADVFDALTAKRCYKEPMESRTAISLMLENMHAHFDPEVVRVLLLAIGLYPPGTAVELSDGTIGLVVGSRGNDLMRPQVALQIDEMGHKVEDLRIVDLSTQQQLYIKRCLHDIGKVAF